MSTSILQLKVTLENIRPPIWRRVLAESNITLGDLHLIIQAIMPWQNYHLHTFLANETYYSPLMADDDFGGFDVPDTDEESVILSQVLPHEKSWIRYTYDMGDGWDHKILLEKVLAPDPKVTYPTCIKGKRACPPEDCGGAWGYMELLEILSDPNHPEYAERMEWYEDGIDAEAFDLSEINEVLKDRNDLKLM